MIPESEPHVRAVIDKLKAEVPALLGVALGVGPATDPPYLSVYPDPGDVASAFLSDDRSTLTIDFIVHGIGAGPEQALWAMDKARVVLLGAPPAVTGRKVHRIQQTFGNSVDRDDSTQPALYLVAAGFRLFSQYAG